VVNPSCRETALYYYVDDLPGANISSSRLQKILDCLSLGKPVTRLQLEFLQQQGLKALHCLATGALPYYSFRELALAEQAVRIEAATAARLAREAELRTRAAALQARMKLADEQAEVARRARESDPKYVAKIKNQKLRARYGLDIFVEQHCFGRLMKILKDVDANRRLSEEDFVWLSSVGENYFSDQLRTDYHRLEAEYFTSEFKKTRDPWKAVSASSHYRKCKRARDADSLLGTINVEQQKSHKLKSALCTTRGGVMRDLGHRDEALRLGEKAHALKADDYRPCTLLGAIHMETGNYNLGQEWYAKAIERGATVDFVDQDLRSIFFRADKAKQAEMRGFLLSEDPVRYAWVTPRSKTHKRRPQFQKH
jgi:tetratricopeptide (TPR) repeat protein